MKKLIILFLFAAAYHSLIFSQNFEIIWQQCYGGSQEELVYDAAVINDKLYIVGATKSQDGDVSFNHGTADAWLIVADTVGNIIWEKTYGGSNGDWFAKILPTDNNTIYLLGSTASSDGDISYDPYPGSRDIWVVKIDILGNILWEKVIGGGMIDNVESGALASDGGVVVFGWTGSQDGEVTVNYGMYDMWLVKLNSDGNIEWNKSFGTDDFDYGHAIISTSDGGYLIGGASTIGSGGNLTCVPYNHKAMAILIKLDSIGNIEWQNCYGGSGHDGIYGLIELDDGYAFTAFTNSPDGDVSGWHGSYDIWFVRLDISGNIIWEKCFGGTDSEIAHHLFVNANGDFTIIGKTSSNDGDVSGNNSVGVNNDIWVFRIDNQGLLLSQQCFGGIGNEAVNGHKFGVAQKSDNNFVIATITNYGPSFDVGCTPYGGNGDIDYWVFEIMLDDTTNVIEPVAGERGLWVYPNPASQWVAFNYTLPANAYQGEITIVDAKGAVIDSFTVTGAQGQQVWDTRSIKPGVYFYTLSVGEFTKTGKIVINR